ncbi:MAG: hypothetical protein K2G47_00320 [Muribaculum sp.]|nr:hypothetical protein [Muribaculum sp.]
MKQTIVLPLLCFLSLVLMSFNVERQNDNGIDIVIDGNELDGDGVVSAYTNHLFRASSHLDGNLTECEWNFSLPLEDGSYVVVESSMGSHEFEISPVNSDFKYQVDENGISHGVITFTAKSYDKKISATCNVGFNFKPKIVNVELISRTDVSDFFYDLHYVVEYYGSDYLIVEIEKEYDPVLLVSTVYEPLLTHVVTKELPINYDAWIYLRVENQYGTDAYTISLPAGWSMTGNIEEISDNEDFDSIVVYNLSGCQIAEIYSLDNFRSFAKGMYILDYIKDGKSVKTLKYFNK